jgi:hypothetical protein
MLALGSAQGAFSAIRGGKFKTGLISGMASKLSGVAMRNQSLDSGTKLTVASIIGGLSSKASGGDFFQGAVSAMFVYLFNDLQKALKKFNKAKPAGPFMTPGMLLNKFLDGENHNYSFGPKHHMTLSIKNDPRLQRAIALWRNRFYFKYNRWPTKGDDGFLPVGTFFPIQKGGMDMTIQFVGSYTASIYFESENKYTVYVYNKTSWKSALYHIIPDSLSNKLNSIEQHYMWQDTIK